MKVKIKIIERQSIILEISWCNVFSRKERERKKRKKDFVLNLFFHQVRLFNRFVFYMLE